MNKTAIKNFAVWARTKLRDDIKIRAGFLGINEDGIATPLPASTQEIKYFEVGTAQPIALSGEKLRGREKIVEKLQKKANETDYKTAYDLMVETYASDWFNRFVALRFMEVNERFSDNMRVLSSSNPDRHDPDIVSQPFSSELDFTDKERAAITEWKTKNETDKLFRFLLIKKCNHLSKVLPGLFEEAGDESELMMRQSFIDKDGVIYRLVNDIDEEDWKDQVQIIGWLYQYYNSEPKAVVDKKVKDGGKVTKYEVPAKTQLFTPDWIVRYIVENSLGHIWIKGRETESFSEKTEEQVANEFGWNYYVPNAKQNPDVYAKTKETYLEYGKLNPEDLTFIDPSMGSGHILVYAFDVLMQIYESRGYTRRDAAKSIVEHNIYGLDIDDRAYQLAYFAIMMKACEYDNRFLGRGINPHVYSIQESNNIDRNHLNYLGDGLSDIKRKDARNQIERLLDLFDNAKEYGSILDVEDFDWKNLKNFIKCANDNGQMTLETLGLDETRKKLQILISIGETMNKKYWCVCTNPPYLNISDVSGNLKKFIEKRYKNGKNDLFSVFILHNKQMAKLHGIISMITQQSWMFSDIYVDLRSDMEAMQLLSVLHLGAHGFNEIKGEVVQTAAFTFVNTISKDYLGSYYDLTGGKSEEEKEQDFLSGNSKYFVAYREFEDVPNKAMAYWLSHNALKDFDYPQIGKTFETREGMTTAGNNIFLRGWFEVEEDKIAFDFSNSIPEKKWFHYNKGGDNRSWYGNNEIVVNWEHDGQDIKNNKDAKTGRIRSHNYNGDYGFRECGTWTAICSGNIMVRYTPKGFLFDSKGPSGFCSNHEELLYCIGLLNSKVSGVFLRLFSPSFEYKVGHVYNVPFIESKAVKDKVIDLVNENITISKIDWNALETSWEFAELPIVAISKQLWNATAIGAAMQHFYDNQPKVSCPLELCWLLYKGECEERFIKLKKNEEELNKIFIDVYGLQDELTPEKEDVDVTIRKADLTRDIKSLVSYSVGCMLGRYSLDKDGLVYAGGDWDISKYISFQPDADNIIPVTDARYLEDDIVEKFCEWLKVVFGDESLEDNLTFIANSIGSKGTDSRDILRNYFLNEFFKDHCQTYSVTGSGKRPIYWLFDSGKQNAFKAIVYMHRIDADTIGRVRISYLHPLQEKYENEVRSIDNMIQGMTDQRKISAEEKRREKLVKQIAEIKEYDEKLDHLAQERIEIDLDDGVKVNYEKIQTDRDGKKYQILAPIK